MKKTLIAAAAGAIGALGSAALMSAAPASAKNAALPQSESPRGTLYAIFSRTVVLSR